MKHFGLSGEERIKSKKDFEKIFSLGKTAFSSDHKIKAIYITETSAAGVRFAAAVSRKSGKAVWRNRLKRLLRESFRLNKKILIEFSADKGVLLKVIFSPQKLNGRENRVIGFDEIEPAVLDIMKKIAVKQ